MADSKIELRSEKVRNIIGEIPSGIVRYGITIITIVLLILLVGAYFIPYPETISARIEMTDRRQGTVDIPYKYVNTVKKGKNVSIELEGYDTEMYGAANGTITATSPTPRQTAAGSVFTAQVRITDCKYKIIGGMTGTASILVSNESVLQRILQRITNIM
ncbi:HlyD family efflux transporter periplasmic adaptor subunit [Prevotella pallens]|uniref:HlyD family efflux transporter periplasmic adaptor subunit n=1 Tax=Prevotella pallens TaxID=60133 RepID=UPI001CB07496|nr:HlyD family efflux transporter periplasmic adaptor subunit [Prevotella pallens]MBF1482883.1 HlyD family efflux transporter periplasmic adaptor subunit [Prevotella pallens]